MNLAKDNILPGESTKQDLEVKRITINENLNPFLQYSDLVPDELIQSLHDIITQQNFTESSQKVIEFLISPYSIENPVIPLYYQQLLADEAATEEQKSESLIVLAIIVKHTPIENTPPIDPPFLDILMNYFPNSLAISICSDLISRDIIYMNQFLSIISRSRESLYQSPTSLFDTFFASLRNENFEGLLILLKSLLQYTDNLIYLGNIFDEIFHNLKDSHIQIRIQCFEVLTLYFESDNMYLSKLFSSPKTLTSLFNFDIQFQITDPKLNNENQQFIDKTLHFNEKNSSFPSNHTQLFEDVDLEITQSRINPNVNKEIDQQIDGNDSHNFNENQQSLTGNDEFGTLIEAALKFIHEVIRSNEEKSLTFFEMAQIPLFIIRTIPCFSEKSYNLCCDIFLKMIRSHPNETINYLISDNILKCLNEMKKSFSFQTFLNFMELSVNCINQVVYSDVIPILDLISLVDICAYSNEIDKSEASPFLTKIAESIKQGDHHIEESILDELQLLASVEDEEDYSNISYFLSLLNQQ